MHTVGARCLALAILLAACGSGTDEGLYAKPPSGGGTGGGEAGSPSTGGTGGIAGSPATGGTAGSAGASSGGTAGVPVADASADVTIDASPADAAPDGNDPTKCPPDMPANGSACNVLINNADCVYGFKHCVCTVSSWLCVP